MLPHREKHRRARLGKDIAADLECAALAHRRSKVKKGIGAAELTRPVAAEIHRVEDQPLALFEILPECLIGQWRIAGEVLELRAVPADLIDDLEVAAAVTQMHLDGASPECQGEQLVPKA